MDSVVTPISAEDEDAVFAMLLGLHEENGLFTVDEDKVRGVIREATEQRGGIIGVIRGAEGLEASIGLAVEQWWYTNDWCVSERWVYVVPAARRKNHAKKLIDYARWCAESLGVPLECGIMSTNRTAAKERLYERKLTPIGRYFMWVPGGEPVKTGMPS